MIFMMKFNYSIKKIAASLLTFQHTSVEVDFFHLSRTNTYFFAESYRIFEKPSDHLPESAIQAENQISSRNWGCLQISSHSHCKTKV